MGVRLKGGFTSIETGSVYVVNIHDTTYSGTVINFDLFADGLTIDYDHKDKGRNVSVLTSKVRIKMILDDSDKLSFLQDVVASAEGRFRVEILKDTNKFWYGFILPDLLDRQDYPNPVPSELNIKATDGLGRLQKLEYNDSGTSYTGKATFLDHLFNILGKVGFDDFYADDEDYVVSFVNWWDTNHVYSATQNPFELSRFDHRALIEVDSGGETLYNTCYDVLEQIVKAWNCRFMFSEGAYYLVQINSYETDDSTKVLKRYDKNKTLVTTSTTDFDTWTQTTGEISLYQNSTYNGFHSNGIFRYYPALRKVEVSYEHYSTDNFIPGYEWSDTSFPTATFSTIDYNGGAARLVFNSNLEVRADFATAPDFQVCVFHFRIQFKVGTKYLARNSSFVNGNFVYGDFFWSSSIEYVDFYSEWIYLDNSPRYNQISFITPLLEASGDLEIIISKFAHYNTSGSQIFTGADNFTAYYTVANTAVQIFVEGNLKGQTNIDVFTATNNAGSTNSETEEVSVLVGDGPSPNTFGAIQVYDDTTWVASTDWRKGNAGTYVPFGQLLANELLAGQALAIERLVGDVTGSFFPHGRLRRINGGSAINYVFVGGSLNLHKDIWSGEWIQVDIDNLKVTASGERTFVLSTTKPRRNAGSGRNVGGVSRTATLPPTIDIPLIQAEGQEQGIYTVDTIQSPTQIGITTTYDSGTEITSIAVEPITEDGVYFEGDEIVIITPLGEQIPAIVAADTMPGDTSVSVLPVTPGVNIPRNSTISIRPEALASYIQRSRLQKIEIYANLGIAGEIIPSNAFAFLRVDSGSEYFGFRAKAIEVQVHTPGSGGGDYDFKIKKDGVGIESINISESTEIKRSTISFTFEEALYSFHIEDVSGSVPYGVNLVLEYVQPAVVSSFISTSSTIYGPYAENRFALAAGVNVNQLYEASLGHEGGVLEGMIIQLYATTGYPSDDFAAVNDDDWYALSKSNNYGFYWGLMRVKNYSGTKYADDTAAGTGGVAIGGTYVLSIPDGFLKVRKS